ncbi:hypothetical protein FY528_16190 [Hymenobacter lutimineralis]|uniref:Uncharacterized protein n=1 Tax=Hymenobacter lutimineralis TaxID=2606448 RepID=A0A5D6UU15_9BACT|nr:hypothetical protein [Hymenobacter lutimineralis]TYZ07046.1 hypothetical protein FY528_16190 [Hymenobacter lutimineralis]
MASIEKSLVAARAEALASYSPYTYLRTLSLVEQQKLFGSGLAASFGQVEHQAIATHGDAQFLYTYLPWDSAFFQAPVYRLFTILFDASTPILALATAVEAFCLDLKQRGARYIYVDLPIEDTRLTQALGIAGWGTVETRLHFYYDQLDSLSLPRYAVRNAMVTEAEHIGRIAAKARNNYDRFHADAWFSLEQADAFLYRYASEAVKGYCDAVLVPAESNLPVDSFLAITDQLPHMQTLGFQASRITLTAVGPLNRGWHYKLVSETLHRAREAQHQYVLMTTQATNRAVFRTCEKLGFRLGSCSHILSRSF